MSRQTTKNYVYINNKLFEINIWNDFIRFRLINACLDISIPDRRRLPFSVRYGHYKIIILIGKILILGYKR